MTVAEAAQRVTLYAPVERMEAWLRRALPGQSMVYAHGAGLEGLVEPSARLAAEWQRQGLVQLNFTRSGEHPGVYVAVRLPYALRPFDGLRAQDDRTGGDVLREPRALRLYQLLAGHARRPDETGGLPCPSNAEIAELLDWPTREAARYRFGQLVKAGLVRVVKEAGPAGEARVIEIVATGARTA